jgi:hypothetical protein
MEYEERKANNYIFSFAKDDGCIMNTGTSFNADFDGKDRESELNAVNCTWRNMPQDDVFLFSVNERDDKKGFNVDLRNIKVCKNTAMVVENCPLWLKWILSKLLETW